MGGPRRFSASPRLERPVPPLPDYPLQAEPGTGKRSGHDGRDGPSIDTRLGGPLRLKRHESKANGPDVTMPEKSSRRLKLEAGLAEQPGDEFLRYALGMQCLNDGDTEEGRQRLLDLIADQPNSIAAYLQLGISFAESEEAVPARAILEKGIQRARMIGDHHAASEMEGVYGSLEGLG